MAITNKRMVFLSPQRMVSVDHAGILSLVIESPSGLVLHTAKCKAPVILSVDGCDAALVALLVKLFSRGYFTGPVLPDDSASRARRRRRGLGKRAQQVRRTHRSKPDRPVRKGG